MMNMQVIYERLLYYNYCLSYIKQYMKLFKNMFVSISATKENNSYIFKIKQVFTNLTFSIQDPHLIDLNEWTLFITKLRSNECYKFRTIICTGEIIYFEGAYDSIKYTQHSFGPKLADQIEILLITDRVKEVTI